MTLRASGLQASGLREEYRGGRTPSDVVAELIERLRAAAEQPVWITLSSDQELLAAAEALELADPELPLYGIPFAVKDNMDVAGMRTTAGCPGFAYVAEQTAPVVQRLLDAGALLVGKTNMDQFATGLVGTRSPYGRCSSVADPSRVSGGSSSGSALAVALGLVAFALGTDTAGSGRVPAAFNDLVGIKPTRGLLSTRGVVPACASLDCVSIFANTVADAALVLDLAAAPDPQDPWSRVEAPFGAPRRGRIGVPVPAAVEQQEPAAALAWAQALERAAQRWTLVEVDVEPLLGAAPLLYDSWVAERSADFGEVIAAEPEGLDPNVASIVLSGLQLTATDVFAAQHRLIELQAAAAPIWRQVDALLLPTTALHPTHAEVDAEPLAVNARLGAFTNFVNLMDLCALALPGPLRGDGLPFGVTLQAPRHHDRRLLELGSDWTAERARVEFPGLVRLAVAGAHMRGMPLNDRLTERGARHLADAATAPHYRLYALAGEMPRPGVVRVQDGGASLELEVWELSPAALGEVIEEVPPPLAVGHLELSDGSLVAGFVCEGHAADCATDITVHGGWRAYLDAAVPARA
jgi:allophanate hydrolase